MAPPLRRPGSALLGSGRGRALRVLALPALLAVATTAAAPGALDLLRGGSHRVVAGDTLWQLAQSSGTSVQAIKDANHLDSDTIMVGELLQLPGAGADATAATVPVVSGPTGGTRSYVVVAGDTLTGISARYGVNATAVRTLNHLPADGTVQLGATLQLPTTAAEPPLSSTAGVTAPDGRTTTTPGRAGSTATTTVKAAARPGIAGSRERLALEPVLTHAQVGELVRAEAVRQGVPADLAQAIAFQESGFTQAVVSSTNAVGVMQLMPATAAWIGPTVLGRSIDRFEVGDNIAGGVALLKVLLRVTDTSTAVAAYYEGLAQIRAHGLYRDTRAYVASVLALRARFR